MRQSAAIRDLSKGSHIFQVRVIDSRGFIDMSPATFTWTVNRSQLDATLTGRPDDPTTERSASFTFSGDAIATHFECSLDGGAYIACTSPQTYTAWVMENTFSWYVRLPRPMGSGRQIGMPGR